MPLDDMLEFPGLLLQGKDGDANCLRPLLTLRESALRYLASPKWKDVFLELLATHESLVGEVARAHEVFDSRSPERSAGDVRREPGVRLRCAVGAIREAARDRRFVFLNEAHHVPQHRAFGVALLEGLYEDGFRVLAVEALAEEEAALSSRGYPAFRSSGIYVREPGLAVLVRRALELGYRVVPYDAPPAAGSGDPMEAANERERAQAERLAARTLDVDRDSRVLVHAGYAHVVKAALGRWVPMAARFVERTGVDPLTVDQTRMTERSSPAYESAAYRAVEDSVRTASVAFNGDGAPRVRDFIADLQVVHPRTRLVEGRPHWLTERPGFRSIPVPEEWVADDRPRLVQAFLAHEEEDPIPVDQILLTDASPAPSLVVPERPLRLRCILRSGEPVGGERTIS